MGIEIVFGSIGGLLCIAAAVCDWDWFFDNYRARPFVKLLGRNGARVFYAILGALLMILVFMIA